MNKPVSPVVIIGCGDIGTQVAQFYLDQGVAVHGLVRSIESVKRLQSLGISTSQADLSASFKLDFNVEKSQLYYFAPPPAQGTEDIHTSHLLAAMQSAGQSPSRIVYISTTGVYGDCQGRWISEDEPVKPEADRARRRLDAEIQLSEWTRQSDTEIIILRVAGIYGPGKLPLARLRKGLPVIRESEAPFTNRIHSADLVKMAITAMQRGHNRAIYHACDGHPGTMTDYFKQVARKAGLPPPKEISLAEGEKSLSAGMMSYMRESRRLSNTKTLRELDLKLAYPSLQEGLQHCGL